MSQNARLRLIILLLILALLLAACNMPGLSQPTPADAGYIYTAAAQTVQAQTTLSGLPTQPVVQPPPASVTPIQFTPPPTQPFMPSPTPPVPGFTPAPTLPSAPSVCDRVKFLSDVTVPDNSDFAPGTVFIKTWRLQNAGSCSWNSAYTLVVEGDNLLKAPASSAFTNAVIPPGGTVDVSVSLTAPDTAGVYRQNFKLANPSGQRFGLGENNKPFWAQIEVVVPGGITYDFIARASQAEWKSGTNTPDTPLAFGGTDDDANGVAKIKSGVLMENGIVSGKILMTVPKRQPAGLIQGVFQPYLVQKGDHLIARLGFLSNADGFCGDGKVSFEILYNDGVNTLSLGKWNKICDGKLLPIDLNLSGLNGKTIQFIFLVRAEGDALDDWAIWNSARIER